MKNKFATLRQAENLAEKVLEREHLSGCKLQLKTDIRIKKILMI